MVDLYRAFNRSLITVAGFNTLIRDGLRSLLGTAVSHLGGNYGASGVVLYNATLGTWSLQCDPSAVVDAIDISGVAGSADDRCIDRNGAVVEPGAIGTFKVLNTVAIPYLVGLMSSDLPSAVTPNLRLAGRFEYSQVTPTAAMKGAAGAVTDLGAGALKITVPILDAAEGSNALLTDTLVRVWLKSRDDGGTVGPQTTVGWYEDCAIQWDGANNFIQTTTYLGQASPSVVAGDYEIALLGPLVRRSATGLPTAAAKICQYTGTGAGLVIGATVVDWRTPTTSGVYPRPYAGGNRFWRLFVADDLAVAGDLSVNGSSTLGDLPGDTTSTSGPLDVAGTAAIAGLATTQRGIVGGDSLKIGGLAYVSEAASTSVVNTAVATDFDKKYTVPADSLNPGTRVLVRAAAKAVNATGANSLTLGLYLDTLLIGDVTILAPAAGEEFIWDFEITIRSGGADANRDYVSSGNLIDIVGGTATHHPSVVATNGLDTTVDNDVRVVCTWGAANPGDEARLESLSVFIDGD